MASRVAGPRGNPIHIEDQTYCQGFDITKVADVLDFNATSKFLSNLTP